MKLISSSKNGKHAAVKQKDANTPAAGNKVNKKKMSGRKKAVIIIFCVLGLIIMLAAAALAVLRWEVQPFYDILFPNVAKGIETVDDPGGLATVRTPRPIQNPDDPDATPHYPGNDDNWVNRPLDEVRNVNKLTFLILGVDGYRNLRSEGGSNTDAIMIAAFDMDAYTLEVTSIPRDMLVNVPWNVKKMNSIWASSVSNHRGSNDIQTLAMNDTKEYFADFLGFNLDFWVMLDMEAFVTLVDAMPAGGVRFDVPRAMHLEDPDINMDVYLNAGEQLLNGQQALAFVRYRGFGGGDYTRIEHQQLFLKAAAEQLLSRSESINITTYAEVFLRYVRTDIELNNLIRIAREMLKLDSNNINFTTAPSSVFSVSGRGAGSYVRIHLDEWLEIVNTRLNPFYHEITPQHVSILTLDENKKLYVTDDHWQGSRDWGN